MPLRTVFISRGQKQHEAARTIARDLEIAGHRAFVDGAVTGDERWWDNRLAQIRECDVFMPVLSRDFGASAICARDATYAVALSRLIVPVRMEPVPATTIFAAEMSRTPAVDFSNDPRDGAIRLITAINGQPDAPPLPDPLPAPPVIPPFVFDRLRSRIASMVALGQKEQLELLARIRDLGGDGYAHAVQELLTGLRARPDVVAPTVVEIGRLLADEPGV